MHHRSAQPEYLDIGQSAYTREEYDDCLNKLGAIGKTLGGDRATISALRSLSPPPESILDVGCGGGTLDAAIANTFPGADVLGIEIDPWAVDYARKNLAEHHCSNLRFESRTDAGLSEAENSFDVVTCSLVCHHMSDTEIVAFLKQSADVARQAIVINDLHRHPLAWLSFALVAPLFFRNRLILHDGLLSVKRSFKRSDWANYLEQAGFCTDQYTIEWKWAFRWIVTVRLK